MELSDGIKGIVLIETMLLTLSLVLLITLQLAIVFYGNQGTDLLDTYRTHYDGLR